MIRMHMSGGRVAAAGPGLQPGRWGIVGWIAMLAIGLLGGIGITAADQKDQAAYPAGEHPHRWLESAGPGLPETITAREPAGAAEHTAPARRASKQRSASTKAGEDDALLAEAIAMIESFEGRRRRVYTDTTGHATIGVGFNLDRPGARADLAKLLPGVSYDSLRRGEQGLADEQIDVLLRHDASRALEVARRDVENFDALHRRARLILIDMAYNLGSLSAWVRFRAALAASDFDRAADEMHDSRWRRQTGRRAASLIGKMRAIEG